MILLRHWKMILGLMAIFGAGVGTGGVGMIVFLHKVFTIPVVTQRWVDDKMADLDRKLKLTPDQKMKIRPIVTAAAERSRAIGGETYEKFIVSAEQAHSDVAKELAPQQQAEFKKMRSQVINALRDLAQREINLRSAGKRGAAPARPVVEAAPDAPRS
jgi:hypothetical protein